MIISGLLFDSDGVIFDSEEPTVEGFIRFMRDNGHALTRADCAPYIGLGTIELVDRVRELTGFQIDGPSYLVLRDEIYKEVCHETGGPHSLPGLVEFTDWLRAEGIPFAIASGGSHRKIGFNIAQQGAAFADRFPVIVSGQDVPRGKPAPDIFIEAARRIGIPPAECIVIEDSVHGLRAARAAGSMALGMAGSHPAEELAPEAHRVYTDHHGIMADIRSGALGRIKAPAG